MRPKKDCWCTAAPYRPQLNTQTFTRNRIMASITPAILQIQWKTTSKNVPVGKHLQCFVSSNNLEWGSFFFFFLNPAWLKFRRSDMGLLNPAIPLSLCWHAALKVAVSLPCPGITQLFIIVWQVCLGEKIYSGPDDTYRASDHSTNIMVRWWWGELIRKFH